MKIGKSKHTAGLVYDVKLASFSKDDPVLELLSENSDIMKRIRKYGLLFELGSPIPGGMDDSTFFNRFKVIHTKNIGGSIEHAYLDTHLNKEEVSLFGIIRPIGNRRKEVIEVLEAKQAKFLMRSIKTTTNVNNREITKVSKIITFDLVHNNLNILGVNELCVRKTTTTPKKLPVVKDTIISVLMDFVNCWGVYNNKHDYSHQELVGLINVNYSGLTAIAIHTLLKNKFNLETRIMSNANHCWLNYDGFEFDVLKPNGYTLRRTAHKYWSEFDTGIEIELNLRDACDEHMPFDTLGVYFVRAYLIRFGLELPEELQHCIDSESKYDYEECVEKYKVASSLVESSPISPTLLNAFNKPKNKLTILEERNVEK